MRLLMTFLAVALAACGVGSPQVSSSSSPTSSATASTGAEDDFAHQRDAICVAASDEIAAMNDAMEMMSPEELSVAFGTVADRIRAAQADLDALAVPAGLADFVSADNARRGQRVALIEQLAVAVIEDPGAMDAIDAALTALNVESERAENAFRLEHCA